MDTVSQIQTAIRYLADRCNHASTQDGAGFSRYDAEWGHTLARRPFWTHHMTLKAWELAKKYEGQLQRGGLTLPPKPTAEELPPAPHCDGPTLATSATTPPLAPPPNPRKITADKEGFSVWFPYSPALVASVKGVGGGRFDGTRKCWWFPRESLKKLAQWGKGNDFDLSDLDPILNHGREEKEQQLLLTQRALQALPDLTQPLPNGKTLMTHQQEAIPLIVKEGRFILGFDMGLGKTLTSLVALKAYWDVSHYPVFLVAPKSTHGAWAEEAASLGLPIEIYSWGKLPLPLETQPYLLAVDEAHRSQAGNKSQRGQAYLNLSLHPNCKVALNLTGTPMRQMRPRNLFPLLKAVKHPLGEDQKHFERYFCYSPATRSTQWDTTGSAHLEELFALTKDKLLRKTKAECLNLPEFTRIFREVEVSDSAAKVYSAKFQELKLSYHERLKRGEIKSGGQALVELSYLNHAASVAKVEGAVEFAQDLLDAGKQVLLFGLYEDTVQALHAALGGELLTGQTPQAEREASLKRFNAGHSQVFVSNLGAGGQGINLQERCSEAIFLDRNFVMDDILQAESRLHRNGQKEPVISTWLRAFSLDPKRDAFLLQQAETAKMMEKGLSVKIPTLHEIAAEIAAQLFK